MFSTGIGPAILPRCSGPSDQGGARGTRIGSIATFPIATLKNKDQPPPSHETRSVEGTQCRAHSLSEMIQVVRSRRGTWHAIRLYRNFAYNDFEEQGPTSSQPRDAKCQRRPVSGPQSRQNDPGHPIKEGYVARD
jgi:hypothetical protein